MVYNIEIVHQTRNDDPTVHRFIDMVVWPSQQTQFSLAALEKANDSVTTRRPRCSGIAPIATGAICGR